MLLLDLRMESSTYFGLVHIVIAAQSAIRQNGTFGNYLYVT